MQLFLPFFIQLIAACSEIEASWPSVSLSTFLSEMERMASIGSESRFSADGPNSAHFFLLRGRREILRLRLVLKILSESCGQAGAADYLEYFLTAAENLKKTP